MAITRAQQAKQLLNKRIPFYAGGYSDSRDDPGGAHQQNMSSNDNGGGGGIGSDRAALARAAAARAAAAKAAKDKEDRNRQETNAIEQAKINPFGKTFVDRGYVNPSTFDVKAAANRPPPVDEEEENKFTKALGKTIDIGKNVGKDLLTTTLTAPYLGPASFAVGPMVRAAREDKARRDAIDAQISNARLSGSFYTGPVNPTRTTRPDITPDGDNDFSLIRPPVMIQPNTQEVIEEEPTPYDFDLYAARDNRVARRFAQGGRTGFNMGGMGEENLQAGAPDLRLEGNQVPQQEEMASAPGIDAELYQLFMDALRKGEIPQGTTFDAYKQLMMQMMSQQQGGQMQEEMMQPEMQEGIMQAQTMMEPGREMAAYGGIMGSDGRRAYGIGSFFKKAARTVKKVLKSPIAKAALLAAGGYYAGGGFGRLEGGFKLSNLPGAGFFKKSEQQIYANSLNKQSNNALKILNNPKNYTAQKIAEAQQIVKNNAPVIQSLTKTTGRNTGMDLAASIGIPAAMALVYKQGKADERPMDENTLARIDQYNNPLFEEGIGGRRAKILAGDNTGMSFVGPSSIYAAEGGRIGANEGGMMNLGGNEMDLRGGGFVPLGAKEKADDVPARLSKNEFVFTADAVRAAGGGSVDKGAEKMYNTMKRLEGVMV